MRGDLDPGAVDPAKGDGVGPRPGGRGNERRATDNGQQTTAIPIRALRVSVANTPSAAPKFPLAHDSGAPVGCGLGFRPEHEHSQW